VGPGGTGGPAATDTVPATNAEAGVITGRVTTEPGEPIGGAELRIVGYTGGDTLGRDIETVTSGNDGVYRYEAGNGLYEVLGVAPIEFDGKTYLFDLEPVDGGCEQEFSEAGIVEDMVVRLTGMSPCNQAGDPTNYLEYHGANVQLSDQLAGSYASDAVVEFILEPATPLADGSPSETLTLRRTIDALQTSFGPLESTWVLHDIPLARYDVSASIVDGGTRVPLQVSLDNGSPADSVELAFEPRVIVGTPSVGYVIPSLYIYDMGG
jgi:hypothetical protein